MPGAFLRSLTRSIRGRVTLLIVAVVVPAGGLAGWLIHEAYHNERQAVEEHLASTTRAWALLIDTELRAREALLVGLAVSEHLASGDYARFRQQATDALKNQQEWIVVMDAEGRERMNTLMPEEAPLALASRSETFWQAMHAGRPYISNLTRGAATQRALLAVSVPIHRQGQLQQVISLHLAPEVLMTFLHDEQWRRSGLIAVMDRRNVIAARNRGSEEFVGKEASTTFQGLIRGRSSGIVETVTLDGVASVTGFHRCDVSGWLVVLAAPKANIFAGAQRLLLIALAAATVVGLLTTFLAAWIGRGVVGGVGSLVGAARAMPSERPLAVRATGLDDTDFVAEALATASQQLAARERELEAVNRSLAAREGELARTRDEAVSASRAKDDFLATLSHELRTPLNPVLLLATDGAVDSAFPPAAREAFESIVRNVKIEARLIDDLLDLTRISRGKMTFEQKPFAIHQVLRDAIATVQAELEQKRITLTTDLQATEVQVLGDAVRLQQVFWNVLRNAVKFTSPQGTITLRSWRDHAGRPEQVVVEVADTGIGLTADELGRIFQPFAQGDHAQGQRTHRYGGLGLGLALSRLLVEQHGGQISARSPGVGKGAVFTIRIPVLPPTDVRRQEPPAALAPAAAAAEPKWPDPDGNSRRQGSV